jgi:hemerythrin superfamily protein
VEITELLTRDHREVDELFRRYNLSEREDSIEDLTGKIIHELSVHAAVEELFVYPLIRAKVDGGKEAADHAIEEHQQAKRLLTDIEKSEPADTEHQEAMRSLIATVRDHVAEEEDEVFPALRAQTGDELREQVGAVVEKAKVAVPTHPHPLVPGTATAQLMAGPWASAVDKVRDILG